MKQLKLTQKDGQIWAIIVKHNQPIGPTDIGLALGKTYNEASSYCSNSIKKLVSAGKIKRYNRKYVAIPEPEPEDELCSYCNGTHESRYSSDLPCPHCKDGTVPKPKDNDI